MQAGWYVIQVMSSQEKKVKRVIEEGLMTENGGFVEEVLLPTENVFEVKQGQRKVVEKRLWPGYLLVKLDLSDEAWSIMKGINGIIGFLGGGKPEPLSDDEVKAILADLESKKEKVTQKYQFEVGDKVKITDGVFINFVGEVVEMFPDKGHLSVQVSIFGRDTRVDDLEFWQVEEASEEDLENL